MRKLLLVFVLAACATGKPKPEQAALSLPLPEAPRRTVVDRYHGTEVTDDYRWLEDWSAPEVKAWSEAQNARARAFLDNLPGIAPLRDRIKQILTARPPAIRGFIWRAGKYFAYRSDPAHKQQRWVVLLGSLDSEEGMKTLVDPNQIDPSGHTAIDWFIPSPDGSKLAVSISRGGSESGTLHIYDVATGSETGDVIPRVQAGTASGSVAWNADSTAFWYTRYPREGERDKADLEFYQQVYYHKLGTPEAQDAYSLGKEFPRIAETVLIASEDGKRHLALSQNGDGGDWAIYVLPENATEWRQLSKLEDGITGAQFGRDGALWLISKKDAPRHQILRMPIDGTLADAKVIIPQGDWVIDWWSPQTSIVYALESRGGTSRIRSFDLNGQFISELPIPKVSTAAGLQKLDGDKAFFGVVGSLQPYTGYIYDPGAKTATPTIVKQTPIADFSDAEAVTEEATSKDGTKVPMFVLRPKGIKLDGNNALHLTGYGGFGSSESPSYSDMNHLFIERGVVLVTAVLRGGGEFGEEWRNGGRLTHKQNTFDDFLACAHRLIELGYTKPEKLGIEGGSNGGLLMGAAFTQEPQLFRAVVSHVGIYDMLRIENFANGQFNVTEYGTVKDPEQFKAMYGYSPYHHVKDGVHYPAILMLTGANDPRVDPMQSRKMVARLQAADPSDIVLLRTSSDTGHGGIGAGVDAIAAAISDSIGFMLYELGAPLAK